MRAWFALAGLLLLAGALAACRREGGAPAPRAAPQAAPVKVEEIAVPTVDLSAALGSLVTDVLEFSLEALPTETPALLGAEFDIRVDTSAISVEVEAPAIQP